MGHLTPPGALCLYVQPGEAGLARWVELSILI